MRNTSQDPDFEGPTGHEKRVIHKTHFLPPGKKLRTTRDNGYEWVRVGEGRYKRVKKETKT